MTLRQLEYLIAVAEERSFTRAARRLYVSQPALSHQIRTLEQSLGAAVFARLPDGVELTEVGRDVLPHARAAVERTARATEAAAAAAALEAGEIRLGTLYSIALGIIPAALRAWRTAHPAVRIDVAEYLNVDALVEAMTEGEVDVAVGPTPARWDGPRRPIGTEELVLVLPDGDPLLARVPPAEGIPMADLARRSWVLYAPESGLTRVVEAACAEAGFLPHAAVRTHHTSTAVELAAAGLGPALVPDNVIGPEFAGNVRSVNPAMRRELVAF
ncbi:MAG TPA: LysR family transcriptional regulator, partial [Solirubrobacteraceae bacterium]